MKMYQFKLKFNKKKRKIGKRFQNLKMGAWEVFQNVWNNIHPWIKINYNSIQKKRNCWNWRFQTEATFEVNFAIFADNFPKEPVAKEPVY